MTSILYDVRGFGRDEHGGMTAFGIFLTVGSLAIGGLAIDVSHAFQLRTRLQIAADGAAHAAIVAIQTESEAVARADAMEVIERSLPAELHGEIIRPEDIKFGEWDDENGGFTVVSGSTQAALVDVRRAVDRQNAVGTFLLTLVGVETFDVWRQSIAYAYSPDCFLEGYIAETVTDVTSGNWFEEDFCIHGNEHVEMSSGNTFVEGSIVSMADRRDLDIPASGMTSNVGLDDALRDAYYDVGARERVLDMRSAVLDPTSDVYPWYFGAEYMVNASPLSVDASVSPEDGSLLTVDASLTGDALDSLDLDALVVIDPWLEVNWNEISSSADIDETTWVEHRVNRVSCGTGGGEGGPSMKVKTDVTLRRGVLLIDCKLQFEEGSALEDVIVINTSTSARSINSASGFRLGAVDGCAAGGGASIYTLGGVSVASGFQMHGSRVVAAGHVNFTAAVGGIEGAVVLSDQSISATAGGAVGLCGVDGIETGYERPSFRIVY